MRGHEKNPQEPWRSRWPWERDIEQSAPTHVRHTHCSSRKLGNKANQRHDVPWDWLQDACQMARVHWGTSCKGFCCKGGLHYQIEQSARNPLEHEQVPRALGELSRSCRQTSNNQPLFMSLEIPWGFLAWAVLRWLSGSLCHARKCQFEEYCMRRKGMICDHPTDVRMRNLWQKAERGKRTGNNSNTRFPRASCFKKMCNVCQKYGGAWTTWYSENQRYKKMGREIGFQRSRERCKETVSSNCAKILEKESSN